MANKKPWLKEQVEDKTVEVMGAKISYKTLSFGESRKAIQGAIKVNPYTKKTEVDQSLAGVLRTISMITDWELTDEDDKPLPINIETFDSLDESFASEVIQKMSEIDENEVTEEEKK